MRSGNEASNDFAIALVKDGQFKVFYFRADRSGYRPAQEVMSADWLNDGLIRFDGDTLDIAPFQSDEIFKFVWNTKSGRPELVPDSSEVVR